MARDDRDRNVPCRGGVQDCSAGGESLLYNPEQTVRTEHDCMFKLKKKRNKKLFMK